MIETSIAIVLLREVGRMLVVKKIGLPKRDGQELQNQEPQKTVEEAKRFVPNLELVVEARARVDTVIAESKEENQHRAIRRKETKPEAMVVERNLVMREENREIAIQIAVAMRIEIREANGAAALELNE